MRILPTMQTNRNFVNSRNINNQAKFQKKSATRMTNTGHAHKYTGNASTDLAYASLFDSSIAKDLKLMGLI